MDTFIYISCMRINSQIVKDCKRLQKQLPDVVENYAVNISHMCKAIGMARSSYYSKIEKLTFTVDELERICNYINR